MRFAIDLTHRVVRSNLEFEAVLLLAGAIVPQPQPPRDGDDEDEDDLDDDEDDDGPSKRTHSAATSMNAPSPKNVQ